MPKIRIQAMISAELYHLMQEIEVIMKPKNYSDLVETMLREAISLRRLLERKNRVIELMERDMQNQIDKSRDIQNIVAEKDATIKELEHKIKQGFDGENDELFKW